MARNNPLLEAVAVTVELMGGVISGPALAVLVTDLSAYPEDQVMNALVNVRKAGGRFSQGAVVKEIERLDGRPSADEAWAMVAKDEDTTVVITEEMAQALGIAQPLLNDGDKIAARRSFIDAYNRITEANRRANVSPRWFPSLGSDKNGREAVLHEAVRLGRLPQSHVAGLLPSKVPVLALPKNG